MDDSDSNQHDNQRCSPEMMPPNENTEIPLRWLHMNGESVDANTNLDLCCESLPFAKFDYFGSLLVPQCAVVTLEIPVVDVGFRSLVEIGIAKVDGDSSNEITGKWMGPKPGQSDFDEKPSGQPLDWLLPGDTLRVELDTGFGRILIRNTRAEEAAQSGFESFDHQPTVATQGIGDIVGQPWVFVFRCRPKATEGLKFGPAKCWLRPPDPEVDGRAAATGAARYAAKRGLPAPSAQLLLHKTLAAATVEAAVHFARTVENMDSLRQAVLRLQAQGPSGHGDADEAQKSLVKLLADLDGGQQPGPNFADIQCVSPKILGESGALYISGGFPVNEKNARDLDVGAIVRFGDWKTTPVVEKTLTVPIGDSHDVQLLPELYHVVNFVREHMVDAQQNVLVHCGAGVSRSAAGCCAWLMAHEHLSRDEALAKLKKARQWARPNDHFMNELKKYEDLLRG